MLSNCLSNSNFIARDAACNAIAANPAIAYAIGVAIVAIVAAYAARQF